MRFLTGVLNSQLVAFWLRYKGKMQGNNYQVDKKPLQEIPLPIIDMNRQQPFISLVDKILATKKSDPQTDTTVLERKIDILVYLLYGLTWDEVQIVENSLPQVEEGDGNEGKKKKGKKKVQLNSMPKLNIDEATYSGWLAGYQKDGYLPSEEEMEKEKQ